MYKVTQHTMDWREEECSPALQVLVIHGSPLLQEEAAQICVTHLSCYEEGCCTQLVEVGRGMK